MRELIRARTLTQVATALVIAAIHVAATLPIAGATYRPFSWMTLARADAATLYPVVQNLSFDAQGGVAVSADVTPGQRYGLQRCTNLMDSAGWQTVSQSAATNVLISLLDTNPVTRTLYYRVIRIVTPGTP